MLNHLCAVNWSNYILDGVLLIAFFLFVFICGKRGFISCFFGIVSTLVAFILAITLAKTLLSATGGLFGLQGVLEGKFIKFFSKLNGFDVDISTSGVKAALQEQDVSALVARLVMKAAGKEDTLAAGTTIGMLLGQSTAKLAMTLLVGILIFVSVKLLMLLLKSILNDTADGIPMLNGVNVFLGSLFGFLYALLIVSVLLALLAILPIKAIPIYLDKTLVVGWLYEHNPLIVILSWLL